MVQGAYATLHCLIRQTGPQGALLSQLIPGRVSRILLGYKVDWAKGNFPAMAVMDTWRFRPLHSSKRQLGPQGGPLPQMT